ncbi:MAG TPA: HlyC/CorC family transporter [bacterium]|nr:HlyC/CorC family transporter [bacterium]
MLSPPVPSKNPDPVSGDAPPDGAREEPEPPPGRAPRPTPTTATPAAGVALVLPFAPLAPERLVVDIDANIYPGFAAIALGAAALGGYGAIAAASLIGYSPTRLDQLLLERKRADRGERTAELGGRDREYFVVATAYAAAGWIVGLWALGHAVDPDSYPWALGSWVALMLFVAGTLPGVFADARAEQTVLRVLPLLRLGWYALRWPLVLPLQGTTNLFVRALRLQRRLAHDPAEVQKQVMAAVADNVDADGLADAERTWIGNILALKDQQVSQVMTPRPDIRAMSDAINLREALDQALEDEFSRYPVYRERIDEVVGIFYVKDALRMMQQRPDQLGQTPLRTLLREPLFVPETTGTAQLLRRIQAGNQHMAIVIDEYGTTVGLATVEDLIEEIVGEIEDEYDPPTSEQGEDQVHVVEAGRVVEIPARTSVQELNRLLGTKLPEDGDWETIAGLVIANCNRIPLVGETVVVDDVEFRVLDADERRVRRLRVTALEPQPAEESR